MMANAKNAVRGDSGRPVALYRLFDEEWRYCLRVHDRLQHLCVTVRINETNERTSTFNRHSRVESKICFAKWDQLHKTYKMGARP